MSGTVEDFSFSYFALFDSCISCFCTHSLMKLMESHGFLLWIRNDKNAMVVVSERTGHHPHFAFVFLSVCISGGVAHIRLVSRMTN
jgi:hypothetical protein